jgi:uncharacterized protein (TIRG00374 family)
MAGKNDGGKGKKHPGFWHNIANIKEVDRYEYASMVKKVITFVAIIFVVSFAVFVGFALYGGFFNVLQIIETANLQLYALAFASVFAGYLLSFGKWLYYTKKLKIKVPLGKNFIVYLSMYSMDLTPGRIGRVISAYTLNRVGNVRFIDVMPIVTMDVFTDFLGMALLALATAIYFNQFVLLVLVADIVLVLPFLFILSDWFFRLVGRVIKDHKIFETFSVYGERYFKSQNKLNKPEVYAVSLLFTIPSAILMAMSLYFALAAIGVTPHLGTSALVFSISQITGSITSIPGNIGVTDGLIVALIEKFYGLGNAASSAVDIMARTASLWFGVVLGGIALFYTLRYWNLKPDELRRMSSRNKEKK